ncbi:uncharacterized protein N7529_007950 [Penicillium soppii]|uniref:uncharacterized protein n=1 Tax=Penicillium soppii TaxID=69789 RepID=UPI002548E80C|nr:uncharacterized protein N7529_007950 [Penicillium soppii]KAJ5860640.1 hypothetical protein N7529_007950 [Penicillium soppii]
MSHHQLSPAAESLRQQIKHMITDATPKPSNSQYNETTVFEQDKNGNKVYDGILLDRKVSELKKQMDLGEEWGWSLAYFFQSRPLINKFSRMWLVPLSEKAIITPVPRPLEDDSPGVALREGFCTLIVDQPTLSLDSTVLFIAPQ